MITYVKPRDYSEGEVQTAVELIKSERPDLWARFTEHEKNDEGFTDIGQDLRSLLTKLALTSTISDMTALLRRIRIEVRRQTGLPTDWPV